MSHRPQVFVIGNHVQACCWHVPRLPRPGETLQATALTMEPGGKGLNVAIGLHRLGLAVSVLLACGQDAAGDALLDCLRREGLDSSLVQRLASASGWGAGLIGADGQNAIAVYPGANLLLSAEHVQAHHDRIAQADLVYGQFETALEAVVEAFTIAQRHHIPTVLNPSPWHQPPAPLLESTNVLLVNETEAAALLNLPVPQAGWAGLSTWADARDWLQTGVASVWAHWPALRCLVVTLGALGASVWLRPADGAAPGDAAVLFMPAACVPACDPVGAGDAFACGFVSQWLYQGSDVSARRWDDPELLQSCLRTAQCLGAHMAATPGVLAGLPDRPACEALQTRIHPGPGQWQRL